jgi:hypothetical protein
MKTKCIKKDWLVVALGAGLVAGGLVVWDALMEQHRYARNAEALNAALGQIYQDQNLGLVLRQLHQGDVAAARQKLDLLLCENILHLEEDLDSADPETRACVNDAWRQLARLRPLLADVAPDGALEATPDQLAAQRILARAAGNEVVVQ